eukprot:3974991-Alexandrium_andersonii.AAC.1
MSKTPLRSPLPSPLRLPFSFSPAPPAYADTPEWKGSKLDRSACTFAARRWLSGASRNIAAICSPPPVRSAPAFASAAGASLALRRAGERDRNWTVGAA